MKTVCGTMVWGERYWARRCRLVELRMDQLEREIKRLKGYKPLMLR